MPPNWIEILPPGHAVKREDLLKEITPTQLNHALAAQQITRIRRGWYRIGGPLRGNVRARSWARWYEERPSDEYLAVLAHDSAIAQSYRGVLGGLSAARAHDWMLPTNPGRPTVIIHPSTDRRLTLNDKATLWWRHLDDDEHDGFVTTPLKTAIHCGASLPLPEASAVLDSALRTGAITKDELEAAALRYRGHGSRVLRLAAAHATPLSANPMESIVRALSLGIPNLELKPQVSIEVMGEVFRVDLADPARRIVVECDSYEYHMGSKELWNRDIDRYNALALDGWIVLRITWRQAIGDPEGTKRLLADAAAAYTARAAPKP